MRGLAQAVAAAAPERIGAVTAVRGLALEVAGLPCAVGDHIDIASDTVAPTRAEVVASARGTLTCMPFGPLAGLRVGQPVRAVRAGAGVPTGAGLLGRVLDGLGRPIDGRGPLVAGRVPADDRAPSPMERARIDTPLATGVRALDTLVTLGRGQRIGLFAGSGVGKSSLLSMVARGTEAEISVIALVGERGREVREFLEDDLGPEGMARSVVVVATSDEPALMRLRAAETATSVAESFRAAGAHALLMMDSLTRVAMAQREIGLSAGEPPATRGYPPSAFALLARLLERAGTARTGSVTGIYTVLVDGDDHNEPVADAARSILDGHVVLDRKLAVMGHYPPIDVLGSISRVATKVNPPARTAAATALRRVLAARRSAQDLIDVGAYTRGANPLVDAALDHSDQIEAFLTQRLEDQTPAELAWATLTDLSTTLGGLR
ncbi:flagellar protein export ATPase FliI [Terrabacter aeriphilus]|uniref:Flagellar protein export ATPase FliI n=1 Tax=Terrabacter aeriphilus TaxID=515662 RepID=A0ABP9JC60_9MICO